MLKNFSIQKQTQLTTFFKNPNGKCHARPHNRNLQKITWKPTNNWQHHTELLHDKVKQSTSNSGTSITTTFTPHEVTTTDTIRSL